MKRFEWFFEKSGPTDRKEKYRTEILKYLEISSIEFEEKSIFGFRSQFYFRIGSSKLSQNLLHSVIRNIVTDLRTSKLSSEFFDMYFPDFATESLFFNVIMVLFWRACRCLNNLKTWLFRCNFFSKKIIFCLSLISALFFLRCVRFFSRFDSSWTESDLKKKKRYPKNK